MDLLMVEMHMRALLWLLPFCLLTASAWSEQVGLRPPGSMVELRAYGFGLLPLDGKFTRFQGWMRYDPANPAVCQVVLEIEAGSLAMSNDSIRDRITGPDMMDVARFPNLAFHGTCHGEAVVGDLEMHGQTHPFTLDYTRSGGTIVATGQLRRAEWGITGSQLVGGSTIRIRVSIPDPVSGTHT
jgi:polyisoprenoid-binding protein YceI